MHVALPYCRIDSFSIQSSSLQVSDHQHDWRAERNFHPSRPAGHARMQWRLGPPTSRSNPVTPGVCTLQPRPFIFRNDDDRRGSDRRSAVLRIPASIRAQPLPRCQKPMQEGIAKRRYLCQESMSSAQNGPPHRPMRSIMTMCQREGLLL